MASPRPRPQLPRAPGKTPPIGPRPDTARLPARAKPEGTGRPKAEAIRPEVTDHPVDKVRVAELDRSIALAEVADDWGVPMSTLTLDSLAQNAPEPARTMFEEHKHSFRQLVAEIEDTALENRKLATSSLRGIQAALDDLMRSEAGATYGASGLRQASPVVTHISRIL